MFRILLIKTSSMGDVIHNLPIVADIHHQIFNAKIDWVMEESFLEIPMLHPQVSFPIPFALRRWRKSLGNGQTYREIKDFKKLLQIEKYDAVLDTQGLLKSALVTLMARGQKYGYAWESAREPIASLFYGHKYLIDTNLHAVERNRQLAAQALGYTLDGLPLDYGIQAPANTNFCIPAMPYAVFVHGTSKDEKLWPELHWVKLGELLHEAGIHSELVWGSPAENERAKRIAQLIPNANVQERLSITKMASLLAKATVVIGVDTGLTHLAAALKKKVVALYVSTDPGLTGVYGDEYAINLGGKNLIPSIDDVWQTISMLLNK